MEEKNNKNKSPQCCALRGRAVYKALLIGGAISQKDSIQVIPVVLYGLSRARMYCSPRFGALSLGGGVSGNACAAQAGAVDGVGLDQAGFFALQMGCECGTSLCECHQFFHELLLAVVVEQIALLSGRP